ncbi:MAG: FtsQ-type POTRA domain-containing protein [Aeromicrobium sp.]|uniref:cell division protein FtsQ/DivIB n=1 Tax=Aeromicrobium sp. TaxID=1871063 RepID=UPI0039E3A5FB
MADRGGSAEAERRFAERRRVTRRRAALRALLVIALATILGGGTWLVGFSDVFALDRLKVTGVDQLTEEEVATAAAAPMGTPLVRVDTDEVAERVGELPMVESAQVRRSWFSRTLRVEVVERTAVAWTPVGGVAHGVDRHGVDFRSFAETPPLTELRIEAADQKDRAQALQGLGEVVATLGDTAPDLLAQVAYVSAATRDSIVLRLSDGRELRWGSAEDTERKIEVVSALLGAVNASVYDVSAPEQPTTAS